MGEDARGIEPRIIEIRGQRVVLDADLARLYGVTTGRFNEAFKRNRRRFPDEFAFQLTAAEFADLRATLVVASQSPDSEKENLNLSQIATGSQERAVQMSVFVIRAFVRLREHAATNAAILKRLAEIDAALLQHDSALRDLYRKLLPLLQPPADPPKRRIGFHTE
jgi:hypothetical protein